jgi:hypothetical protein
MRIKRREDSCPEEISQKRRADLISALEEIDSHEKSRLKVAIPFEVAEKMEIFLKEKGLLRKQGIQMLIEYGLSEENDNELRNLESERKSQFNYLYDNYCRMKFRAYEFLIENKVLTRALTFLLSENQSLKNRLKNEEFQCYVPKDEWDNWDNAVIDDYYRKYVFGDRSELKHKGRIQK